MGVLSAEQAGSPPHHPPSKPSPMSHCFSIRGQVGGVGVAQPLALTAIGPPLVLPDVEVGLVP